MKDGHKMEAPGVPYRFPLSRRGSYRQRKFSSISARRHFPPAKLERSSCAHTTPENFTAGSEGPLSGHLVHWRCAPQVRMQTTSHTTFSLIAFIFQAPYLIYSQLKTHRKAMTRVSYAQMWLMPYHCLPGWPGSWPRSVGRGHEETAPGQRVHMGTVGSQEQRDHGKHVLTSIQKPRKRVTVYMIEEDWI